MTEPRNEFGFEEWYCNEAFDYVRDPIGSRDCSLQRQAWHAAIDAIRAKLAAKELWIAPMEPDEALYAATLGYCIDPQDHWEAMRDSYLAYYGSSFGLDP